MGMSGPPSKIRALPENGRWWFITTQACKPFAIHWNSILKFNLGCWGSLIFIEKNKTLNRQCEALGAFLYIFRASNHCKKQAKVQSDGQKHICFEHRCSKHTMFSLILARICQTPQAKSKFFCPSPGVFQIIVKNRVIVSSMVILHCLLSIDVKKTAWNHQFLRELGNTTALFAVRPQKLLECCSKMNHKMQHYSTFCSSTGKTAGVLFKNESQNATLQHFLLFDQKNCWSVVQKWITECSTTAQQLVNP